MSGMSDSLYLGQFGVIALWQIVNGKVAQFAKGMCAFQWLSSSGLSFTILLLYLVPGQHIGFGSISMLSLLSCLEDVTFVLTF
jgi:hypothetical protein